MDNLLLYEDTKKLPEVFTEDEIGIIFKTLQDSDKYPKNEWGAFQKDRDLCILAFIYYLALRPKEACSLRIDDFNLQDLTVKIRGENNKVKKDRIVPLVPQVLFYLQILSRHSRARFWKGSPYMFPSFMNKCLSAGRWKHIMREKILKPAGIWKPAINSTHPPYRSYTLRHTRATEVMNKSKDIFLVANLLGHSKLQSTKTYLHKSKDYMKYMKEAMLAGIVSGFLWFVPLLPFII